MFDLSTRRCVRCSPARKRQDCGEALAYAKRHKRELQQVETVFIAMDTMREIEQLQIYTSGCTGTQKNSNAVGELIYEAGENCGIEMRETDLYPDAIDAEGFSRYGLEAAGFAG